MNRREFLRGAATGVALTSALGGYVPLYAQSKARRVGLIGSGWYGKSALLRLLQVAPVEVVSLCDVDKRMLAEAAEMVAARQKSQEDAPHLQRLPRDAQGEGVRHRAHRDAGPLARPGHDRGGQGRCGCLRARSPISVDVVEGQAMLAAARKYKRVVQVNTQRRSTPHLIEARDRVIKAGKLGKIAYVEICCYYHMRAGGNPPDTTPPEYLDYEMWTGPAPMRPYCSMNHPRGWRAFMEYGNGIVGDMCVHMLDMVRWMLDLGWPKSVSSSGGILVDKDSKANITDTQTATFDFGDDLPIVWTHRTWGSAPDPEYPWAAFIYGDKGTLKANVTSYEFIPQAGARSSKAKPSTSTTNTPRTETEKDLEKHVASAIRWHMKDFLDMIETRGRPVADIEQGYISTASCILANMSCKLGRSLTWDPDKGQVVGDDEANRLLARPYRSPWVHPDPKQV